MTSSSQSLIERLERRQLFAATPRVLPTESFFSGDLNGDDMTDLAVPVRNGVGVLLGNGDTFTPVQRIQLPTTPRRIVGGDFNNDGRTDLVAGPSADGIIAILIGIEAPTVPPPGSAPLFSAPVPFGLGAALQSDPTQNFKRGDGSMIVGDFDGDGRDDLAVVDQQRGIIGVLVAQFSAGTFAEPVFMPSPLGSGVFVAAGDVNNDGQADLVGLDRRGQIHLALGVALGVWDDTDIVHLFPPRVRVDHVAVGDVNNDGTPDIVGIAKGQVRAASISGGLQSPLVVTPINLSFDSIPRALQTNFVVADIDEDGIAELLALLRTGSGQILPYIEQQNLFQPT